MEKHKYFIGVDVSKDTLDYAVICNGQQILYQQTANSLAGIKIFIKQFKIIAAKDFSETVFCMEHTGIYCNPVLSFLYANNIDIWLESPVQIKRSLGIQRGKNDRVDARRIALYAFRNRDGVKLWQPPRKEIDQLKQLTAIRKRIMKAIGILKRIFSEKEFYDPEMIKLAKASTKQSLKSLKEDLLKVNVEIKKIIQSDEHLTRLFDLVTSVKGIGDTVATQIITASNEFKSITEAKKFACYSGVVPFDYRSGRSIQGKSRVSDMADKGLKSSLHMSALAVVRCRGELQDYFLRKVAEGKNKMSVINAIRNKLILRVFACVRDNRPYQQNYYSAVV